MYSYWKWYLWVSYEAIQGHMHILQQKKITQNKLNYAYKHWSGGLVIVEVFSLNLYPNFLLIQLHRELRVQYAGNF